MIKDWRGKTVIVTGGGTGIGAAVSRELASRGAIVTITGIDLAECENVAQELGSRNLQAYAAKLDVNDWQEFEAVVQAVKAKHGQLDVLINNAGIVFVGEFFEMDESAVEKLLATNVSSVVIGNLYAYRLMKEQGYGLIVNVSSMGGFTPTPSMAVYAASKHAVLGLSHSLAVEAQAFGVDVKAICFGLIESELFEKGEVKHGSADTVSSMLPIKALPAGEAARQFVDQLASTRRTLFVPFYSRVMWWVYRFFPGVLFKTAPDTMKRYRQLVADDQGS